MPVLAVSYAVSTLTGRGSSTLRRRSVHDRRSTYQELLPIGHHDDTPYRLLTHRRRVDRRRRRAPLPAGRARGADGCSRSRRCSTSPTSCGPGHLQQLADILDDPEASPNDRFVALELLKNAGIAAGGVLPGCQDTGTAIVMGKKGERVLTGADDERCDRQGRLRQPTTQANLRYSQMAPLDDVGRGEHQDQPAGPDRDLRRARRRRTTSSSWPRAAARPTRATCSRRPRPCSTRTASCASSTRSCATSAPRPARRTTWPS